MQPTSYQLANLALNPEAIEVYKPRPDGNGVALKLKLRLEPEFDAEKGYVKRQAEDSGGLWLDLVGQTGKTPDGKFAQFGWQVQEKVLTTKLGPTDVSHLLVAIRTVRNNGKAVPSYLRAKQNPLPNVVSLFHKFGQASTAITLTFEAERSMLAVSKSASKRSSIVLTLSEELIVQLYLENALRAFSAVGHR